MLHINELAKLKVLPFNLNAYKKGNACNRNLFVASSTCRKRAAYDSNGNFSRAESVGIFDSVPTEIIKSGNESE